MDLTQKFLAFTLFGANWVLWLLVVLSVVSVTIMLERLFFLSLGGLSDELIAELRQRLSESDPARATELLQNQRGIEARVGLEGLRNLERGADAAAQAMNSTRARERLSLERNLAVLGTLGNNAPFIGLFGTVLGIIKAFHDLAQNQAGGATIVMQGISEALVATAVGLLVAIPAVVAFNYFQRRIRTRLGRTDEITHLVLAAASVPRKGA